jgi:hypothetical protein
MMLSKAQDVFDREGKLIDEKTRTRLQGFLKGFATFVSDRHQ